MGNEADQKDGKPEQIWIALTVPYERKDYFRKKYGQQFYWDRMFRCWTWTSERKLPRDLQFYIHPSFGRRPLDWDWPLKINLVPRSCWFRNLRHIVPYEKWREIRRLILDAAGQVCETCSRRGRKVECHEIFKYDDATQTQVLVGLQALCYDCHKVKHFGMGTAKDNAQSVLAHLCEVNGWSLEAAISHKRKQFRIWRERSELEWKMDFSFLKRHFNTRVKRETAAQRRQRLEKIKQMPSSARSPKMDAGEKF
jgi:hypothetical protein